MSSSAGTRVAMPIEQQPRSIDGAPMPSAFAGEPSAPLLAPAVRAFDVSGGPMLPPDLDDFGSAAILGSDAAADVHLDDAVRVIPTTTLDRRLVAAGSESTAAEQYRALRTRILHADNGTAVNILLVTSPGRAEGKTITAGNLALTMAQEFQRRICLVDADLRHPQIQTLFGLPEGPGLSDVLAGRATLEQALVTIEDLRITLLPAGRAAHPAELLGTTAMRRTIDTLRTRFDRVVVDAPAAAPLADVGILTPLVDSVLLVVRSAVTSKPAIHDAVASIDAGKLLGVVLNDASAS
jgi:capsular exopolysaccharide synthesis family protein